MIQYRFRGAQCAEMCARNLTLLPGKGEILHSVQDDM